MARPLFVAAVSLLPDQDRLDPVSFSGLRLKKNNMHLDEPVRVVWRCPMNSR
jgi:hypothetical protein